MPAHSAKGAVTVKIKRIQGADYLVPSYFDYFVLAAGIIGTYFCLITYMAGTRWFDDSLWGNILCIMMPAMTSLIFRTWISMEYALHYSKISEE